MIPPPRPKKAAPKAAPEAPVNPVVSVPAPEAPPAPEIVRPATPPPAAQAVVRPVTPPPAPILEVKALPTVEEYSPPLPLIELSLNKLIDLMSKGLRAEYEQVKIAEKMSNMVEDDFESQTVVMNINGINNLLTVYEGQRKELIDIRADWPRLVDEIQVYEAANKPASPVPTPSAIRGIPPLPPAPPALPGGPKAKTLTDDEIISLIKESELMDEKTAKFKERYAIRSRFERINADANNLLFPDESSKLDCAQALPYLDKAIQVYGQKLNELLAKRSNEQERLSRTIERKEKARREAERLKAQEEETKYAGIPADVVNVLQRAEMHAEKGEGSARCKSEMARHCRTINNLWRELDEGGLSQADRDAKMSELEAAQKQRKDIQSDLKKWISERDKAISIYKSGCVQLIKLITGKDADPSSLPETLEHLQIEAKRLQELAKGRIQELGNSQVEVVATKNSRLEALRTLRVSAADAPRENLFEQLKMKKTAQVTIKKPSNVTPPDPSTLRKRQLESISNSLIRQFRELPEDIKQRYSEKPFLDVQAVIKTFLVESHFEMIEVFYKYHNTILVSVKELSCILNANELQSKKDFDGKVDELVKIKTVALNAFNESHATALTSYQNWVSEFVDQLSQFFKNKYPLKIIAVNRVMIAEKENELPERFKNDDGIALVRQVFKSYDQQAEKPQALLDNVSGLTVTYLKMLSFMTELETFKEESGEKGFQALIDTSNVIKAELESLVYPELENWFEGFSEKELDIIKAKLGPESTLMSAFDANDE